MCSTVHRVLSVATTKRRSSSHQAWFRTDFLKPLSNTFYGLVGEFLDNDAEYVCLLLLLFSNAWGRPISTSHQCVGQCVKGLKENRGLTARVAKEIPKRTDERQKQLSLGQSVPPSRKNVLGKKASTSNRTLASIPVICFLFLLKLTNEFKWTGSAASRVSEGVWRIPGIPTKENSEGWLAWLVGESALYSSYLAQKEENDDDDEDDDDDHDGDIQRLRAANRNVCALISP